MSKPEWVKKLEKKLSQDPDPDQDEFVMRYYFSNDEDALIKFRWDPELYPELYGDDIE